MDVVSICPLRVASRVWQPRPSSWVLTVVVRGTFDLLPEIARVASLQEPVTATDRFWDDDPARSLHAPGDLAPFKPSADVVLVGSAFAPHQRPVTSLVARMAVGAIDKAITVRADAPFASMPMRYERAAGGPGTANPVGVRAGAGAPNLLPAGPAARAEPVPPVGFGPISPRWPERLEKLGRHAATWAHVTWYRQPLPQDVDRAYFNVAPRDQQIDALHEDEAILLENLHPEHARLSTRLPGLRARVFREHEGHDGGPRPPGAALEEVAMVCDTLWIDTDRSIATLTWRGRVILESAAQPGRILVAMEHPGQPLTAADVAQRVAESPPAQPVARALLTEDVTLTPSLGHLVAGPVMPFATPVAPAPAAPASTPVPAPAPAPEAATSPSIPGSPWAGGSSPLVAPSAPVGSSPWASGAGGETARAIGRPEPPAAPRPAPSPAPVPAPRAGAREVLDLIWFDPAAVTRIRKKPAWKAIVEAIEERPADDDLDQAAGSDDPQEIEDRRDVFEVLARGGAIDAPGVGEAVDEAIREDGKFVPPLVLLAGELELPFDELEALKTTLAVVTPLAAADAKLKEVLAAVGEIAEAPELDGAGGLAEGLIARVREAFGQGSRALTWGQIEAQVERLLLGKRRWQKRTILDAPRIRGLLRQSGAAEPLPAYLPETLAETLPLVKRMSARLVARLGPQQDQGEASPLALEVVALARLVSLGGRR